jgi:hypothetical protein
MSDRHRLLLSQLYYGVDTGNHEADVHGDALLRDLYEPLAMGLRSLLPDAAINWMRFCVGGYHLQLQVVDEEARLRDLAEPMVTEAMRTFIGGHPGHFSEPMRLPSLAQQVSRTFAPERTLARPGTHESALHALPIGTPCESAAQFLALQRLMQGEALQAMRVLRRHAAYAERFAFWRLYAAQLMQSLAMAPSTCAALLDAWAGRWQSHFRLDAGALRERAARLPLSEAIGGRMRQGEAVHAWSRVPAPMAQDLSLIRTAQHAPAAAWRHASSAASARNVGDQVVMLLHLSANRLGVAVLDEAAHAVCLAGALHAPQTAGPAPSAQGVAA